MRQNEEYRHISATVSRLKPRKADRPRASRPLPRVIQEHVKKPLAEELLFGSLVKGGTVRVRLDGDKLAFTFEALPPKGEDAGEKAPELAN